ncbi:hypothetical protein DRQ50_04450 [bacterium]|nr:MAG: hypothetical protein DRQ50_04450 [bacterium]
MKKLVIAIFVLLLASGALAQNTPVYDIQHGIGLTDGGSLCTPRGIVTAVLPDGFFVADYYVTTPAAWDGIYVHMGTVAFDLVPGDIVALCGVYEEHNGLTRINVEFAGLYGSALYMGSTAVPAPTIVTAADLTADPEPWESCVILIQDGMQVTSLPNGNGQWTTLCEDGTPLLLDDFWYDTGQVMMGQCYNNALGIWYEVNGTYMHHPYVDGLSPVNCTVPNDTISFSTVKALYR